jgi:hypothetical protein
MQIPAREGRIRAGGRLLVCAALALLATAGPALAQTGEKLGIGEKYWFEFSATFWQPSLKGDVTKDSLDAIRTGINLASDLGLNNSRFTDFRFVLHPARKHRIKVHYTPIQVSSTNELSGLAFGGISYPVSMLVESVLNWKALRVGYEWDFLYGPHGFVGASIEGGMGDLKAEVDSIAATKNVSGLAPLLSLGMAARVYPIRNLAINMEASGLKLNALNAEGFRAIAYDLSATLNFSNNVGVSAGWRRSNTNIALDGGTGQLNFGGLWLGGVLRY